MEEKNVVSVNLATDAKGVIIPYTVGWTAEDLCIKVCKQIGIGPVARHLFALRNRSTKLWCASGQKLEVKDKLKLDFRLRFKPSSIQRLKQIDIKAYDYYFLQARTDVLDNKVSEIVYEKHKRELIGLGVCDMYRVMLEKDIPREIVESDYKKYIPKECLKRHSFFVKKPIHNALVRLSGHDAAYVKDQYLNQLECMAPNYLLEEYKALMDRGIPNPPQKVLLRINSKEVKYTDMENNIEDTLCAIEDLCFISIRHDGTVEISRKNGIPTYLKFGTNSLLLSFVSGLDGYYRLAIKWTFNLCRDLITPSLQKLHKMKCHGPVGGEFSYAKLEEKRSNRPGTFVLRESETKYNVFYLDVCGKDSKPRTRKIEQLGPDEFILSDSVQRYTSLAQLVAAHQDPENQLYLRECLPPSEYDKSPLLICASESGVSDVVADEELVTELLKDGPRCIPPQELQVYKAQPFRKHYELTSESRTPAITSYRAMWRIAKGKKLGVAIKILEEEESGMTREFFQLAGKWGQLRSTAIARLYGLMLAPAVGMVLELVRYGPLDAYLQTHASTQTIKTVDMVEAAACLATALWHLEENGVVHGNIRCRKLLVHTHNANSLVVKLADPGLFSYTQADVHWLPPECYGNAELAKRSSQADVWALATTFWQIFSRGAPIPPHKDIDSVKRYYSSGKRLPMPSGCPTEVYKLMLECWGEGGGSRKQPQAVMRDINQILYQVYNSRRIHAYETAFPKLFTDSSYIEAEKEIDSSDSESRASSLFTDRTSLVWDDDDEAEGESKEIDQDDQEELSSYLIWLAKVGGEKSGPLGQMQGIFELDADCNVILQGRIGQGFYGEVYKGLLERDNKDAEPQQVAVKKLKTQALEADLRDFEREISIMKTLKHQNVVEILGVISEPEVCLVMEFVKHGSLQSYLAINRETLTHRKLLGFALDIATGMDYLGRKSIVHRDLAARNILVASENRVKISDFGLAQVTGINDYYILQTNRDLPIKWYAPESLRDGKFSPRSDVWSFGVTMYETFGFGDEPRVPGVGDGGNSEGSAELLEALERGSRLPCPPTCPQAVYVKLMYPCWQLQSHERPDFSTLCNDIQDLLTQY